VLDLYEGLWEGAPLGAEEYVICADEKTSIQARRRCHPALPSAKDRPMRVEHEYERKGALTPTWLPGMSTAPGSSDAAIRTTVLSPSAGW
jgi:hypothetical protein